MIRPKDPVNSESTYKKLGNGTPLVKINTHQTGNTQVNYWAKVECSHPGGFKARSATAMLDAARQSGELSSSTTIVESTSGTLGIGLAYAAQELGNKLVLVTDPGMEHHLRNLLASMGVKIIVVDQPAPVGGWQRSRIEAVTRFMEENHDCYWPNQYDNPFNSVGYHSLADEIIVQLTHCRVGAPDILVCSVGTGGHSKGIAERLRTVNQNLQVVGVDSIGSGIFGAPVHTRLMRGLGSSIKPKNVDYSIFSEIHWIGPNIAVQTCRALARNSFHTGGWSTGAVAAVSALISEENPGKTVVTVFLDGPERYAETIFDDDWCNERNLLQPIRKVPTTVAHPAEVSGSWCRYRY